MSYFLKILVAPKKEMVGQKLPLIEGKNLLGRISPPCVLQLDGAKVSKKHCTFHVGPGKMSVEDHNSSNGVFVNGRKVSSLELKDRDRLVIGEYTLEVRVN